MFYATADGLRPEPLRFSPLSALITPRPIGWISTVSAAGVHRLAPYSYFNRVCADPPYLMFAPNAAQPGSAKDTCRNQCEVPEFVASVLGEIVGIHIADDVIRDGRVDERLLRPLTRLGYTNYRTLGEVFAMTRP
jgi:flavin reductase (DIM6/NTAB) family NADH-FMN oxidoreductase RutF